MRGEFEGKVAKERWSFQMEQSCANGEGSRAGFSPDNCALYFFESAYSDCTVQGQVNSRSNDSIA
jgi:hypothetical protein